jgi:hypothetical protein
MGVCLTEIFMVQILKSGVLNIDLDSSKKSLHKNLLYFNFYYLKKLLLFLIIFER